MATMLNGAAVMDAALLVIAGGGHFRTCRMDHRQRDLPSTANLGTLGSCCILAANPMQTLVNFDVRRSCA